MCHTSSFYRNFYVMCYVQKFLFLLPRYFRFVSFSGTAIDNVR